MAMNILNSNHHVSAGFIPAAWLHQHDSSISNVQLRAVPSLQDHPLARLVEAGVPVSLNADDPLMFGSGLLQEYELARDAFGLDDETLAAIAATSIRASGAPSSLKAAALDGIDRWLRDASPM